MTVIRREVYSSHVSTIAYDDETKRLSVTWDTGKTSNYEGVPQQLAESVMNSWSVGTALHDQIKGKYDHNYEGQQ